MMAPKTMLRAVTIASFREGETVELQERSTEHKEGFEERGMAAET